MADNKSSGPQKKPRQPENATEIFEPINLEDFAPADANLSNKDTLLDTQLDSVFGETLPDTGLFESNQTILAWLVRLDGAEAGKHYQLSPSVTLGRDPACTIPIYADEAISTQHAHISLEDGRFVLADLESTNGVLIFLPEQQRWQTVGRQILSEGTRFKLGETTFQFMSLFAPPK